MNEPTNLWKDIPGYDGRYQISRIGEIRSIYKNGKVKIMSQYQKSNSTHGNKHHVKLHKDGIGVEAQVFRLLVSTFFEGRKDGLLPYHKDGIVSNNTINNVGFTTKQELGKMTGARSRRQPVVKIDDSGDFIEFYTSAREAARVNHMSYQTVIDRCNNKCKKAFAPDGYEYAWDDKEISVSQAQRRIEKYWGYMPKARNVI